MAEIAVAVLTGDTNVVDTHEVASTAVRETLTNYTYTHREANPGV
jgi:hypothetical protein